MAFCEHCGNGLSELAVACPRCGHPRSPGGIVATPALGYAGWWQRAAAIILDGIIVGVPSTIIFMVVIAGVASTADPVTGEPTTGGALAGIGAYAFIAIAGALYRILLEGGPRGQTLGKMALKIRVQDVNTGESIGYGRATLRWLVATVLWVACYVPGIVDILFPLWDQKRQTLHDKAATSVVVQVS